MAYNEFQLKPVSRILPCTPEPEPCIPRFARMERSGKNEAEEDGKAKQSYWEVQQDCPCAFTQPA
eukprot:773847-Pelagomonas_calceolata.AAC.1